MSDETEAVAPKRLSLKDRFTVLIETYGTIAFVVHTVVFTLTFAGFAIAISTGLHNNTDAGEAASTAGTLGGAYLAAKLTSPIRIGITLVLTPIVGQVWQRYFPKKKV